MITDTIKQFVVAEFLPDATAAELDTSYDLFRNGVIDSLGLLKLVTWLQDRFRMAIDDIEIAPENFRTVADIVRFVERSTAPAAVAGGSA